MFTSSWLLGRTERDGARKKDRSRGPTECSGEKDSGVLAPAHRLSYGMRTNKRPEDLSVSGRSSTTLIYAITPVGKELPAPRVSIPTIHGPGSTRVHMVGDFLRHTKTCISCASLED